MLVHNIVFFLHVLDPFLLVIELPFDDLLLCVLEDHCMELDDRVVFGDS